MSASVARQEQNWEGDTSFSERVWKSAFEWKSLYQGLVFTNIPRMSHSERLHKRWITLGRLNRSVFENKSTSNQPSPTTFSLTSFPNYSRLSCWCGRTATSTRLSIVQGQMLAVPEPTQTANASCHILSPCLQWCWISLQPYQGLFKLLVCMSARGPKGKSY